jgi:hypothetical protein
MQIPVGAVSTFEKLIKERESYLDGEELMKVLSGASDDDLCHIMSSGKWSEILANLNEYDRMRLPWVGKLLDFLIKKEGDCSYVHPVIMDLIIGPDSANASYCTQFFPYLQRIQSPLTREEAMKLAQRIKGAIPTGIACFAFRKLTEFLDIEKKGVSIDEIIDVSWMGKLNEQLTEQWKTDIINHLFLKAVSNDPSYVERVSEKLDESWFRHQEPLKLWLRMLCRGGLSDEKIKSLLTRIMNDDDYLWLLVKAIPAVAGELKGKKWFEDFVIEGFWGRDWTKSNKELDNLWCTALEILGNEAQDNLVQRVCQSSSHTDKVQLRSMITRGIQPSEDGPTYSPDVHGIMFLMRIPSLRDRVWKWIGPPDLGNDSSS